MSHYLLLECCDLFDHQTGGQETLKISIQEH